MSLRVDPALIPPEPDFQFEQGLWISGLQTIGGVDEAGRGALAGPVGAGVVIFPPGSSMLDSLHGLRDSKLMTPYQREAWAEVVKDIAVAWSVAFASNGEIDQLGIVAATCLAAERALQACTVQTQHLLLDYLFLPELDIPQTKLVKGDQRSLSIAAAAVLVKTTRDALMVDLQQEYPEYNLRENKGYGTSQHLAAIELLGPSPIHRRSFAPMKGLYSAGV
jgi:ribonuclease HII